MSDHFLKDLESAPDEARWNLLRDLLRSSIREILFIPQEKTLENDRGFFDMGMDSFTAIQLKNKLIESIGGELKLESTKIFDYPTINDLTNYLTTIISVKIQVPNELKEKGKSSEDLGMKNKVEELSDEELLRQLKEETNQEEK